MIVAMPLTQSLRAPQVPTSEWLGGGNLDLSLVEDSGEGRTDAVEPVLVMPVEAPAKGTSVLAPLAAATLTAFPTLALAGTGPLPDTSDALVQYAAATGAAVLCLGGAAAVSLLRNGWSAWKGGTPWTKAFSRAAKWGAAATAALAIGGSLTWQEAQVYWQNRVVPHGVTIASQALSAAPQKLAVEIRAGGFESPENAKSLGYAFGDLLRDGVPANLKGADRSIAVTAEDMQVAGDLHVWYEALKYLEDRQLESGMSRQTGINSRMLLAPLRAVESWAKERPREGASSVADQTCEAMEGHVLASPDFLQDYPHPLWQGLSANLQGTIAKKLHLTFCGVGLAQLKSPHEIAALYATYGFVGKKAEGVELFVREYWGLGGIHDPRLNAGQQIVMAAMLRWPWQARDLDVQWGHIRRRAEIGLSGLIANGTLPSDSYDAVLQQIDAARPRQDANTARVRFDPLYNYPVQLAVSEAQERFGAGWRKKVAAFELTIDPAMQRTLQAHSELALRRLPSPIGVSALAEIHDDEGAVHAIVTGMLVASTSASGGHEQQGSGRGRHPDLVWQTGEVDRFNSFLPIGSQGKIMLAVSAAHYLRGEELADDSMLIDTEDPTSEYYNATRAFHENLRQSAEAIVQAAEALGVPPDSVEALINCYGSYPTTVDPYPLLNAAKGVFATTPALYGQVLSNIATGRFYDHPHVVRAYLMRDGTRIEVVSTPVDKPSANCDPAAVSQRTLASVMHNPLTLELMAEPLSGTLHDLRGLADMGKTGTVGGAFDRYNNRDGIIAGWYDGAGGATYHASETRPFYTYTLTIGMDDNVALPVPGLGTAGEALGPVAAESIRVAKIRLAEVGH